MTAGDGKDLPSELNCEPVQWRGRDAVRLANATIELITLLDGGHFASLRWIGRQRPASRNVLWEAPWDLRDSHQAWGEAASLQYGSPDAGRFLAGYTGHALCLDYFGDPDPEKAALGLGLHGEAAVTRWHPLPCDDPNSGKCGLAVNLPLSRLRFERTMRVQERQSVVYIEQTLCNESDSEILCDWVEHATFGPPFLCDGAGALLASATAGTTSSLDYGGRSLLPAGRCFSWPFVPLEGGDHADLRLPFTAAGKGFLAGLMLDPKREIEFTLAIDWRSRLGVGYCFRRADFPWMAVWEENCARQDAPWNGHARARGMEFGTTPLPRAAGEIPAPECFGNAAKGCRVPAMGKRTARYVMFLFEVPEQVHSIHDVTAAGDTLVFSSQQEVVEFSLPAVGCEQFLR